MESIKMYYYEYRKIILFNKNLILAGIISAVADILIVNYVSNIFESNYLIIAGISLAGDFLIYNILFIFLYFFDNRSEYINLNESKNRQRIKQDLKKLITVIGFAEISYLTTKFFSTFIIFELFLENPALISAITTLLAWMFYITIANITAKKQQLFK
jgi:hypothetical protein